MERRLLWEERIEGGATWSHILRRGTALRIIDREGGANVGAILYNADNATERYNMPDTLKAQHVARLTAGSAIYSDMGRVLCSVTHDSLGWHDPIAGCSNERTVTSKYGEARYQECHNDYHKNALDSFLIELAKFGLGRRDLTANINFFSKVFVSNTGRLNFVPGHSSQGSYVELRAEMNVLLVLNTCQHPLDPGTCYMPHPVELQIYEVPPPAADDLCRVSRPENARGFTLTERYYMGGR
ncbi:MAG TPA: urea amidolyase associated protein UAAP1 [Bryobacteraceae bacterium]|nr:urea amidolyase associated protein UAAP1 [Bryobacteraceae bacterium]